MVKPKTLGLAGSDESGKSKITRRKLGKRDCIVCGILCRSWHRVFLRSLTLFVLFITILIMPRTSYHGYLLWSFTLFLYLKEYNLFSRALRNTSSYAPAHNRCDLSVITTNILFHFSSISTTLSLVSDPGPLLPTGFYSSMLQHE